MTLDDYNTDIVKRVCRRHGLSKKQLNNMLGYCKEHECGCIKWVGPIKDKNAGSDTRQSYLSPDYSPTRSEKYTKTLNVFQVLWELETDKLWPKNKEASHINRKKCKYKTLCMNCYKPETKSKNNINKSKDGTNPAQAITYKTAIKLHYHIGMRIYSTLTALARAFEKSGASNDIVGSINRGKCWMWLTDKKGRIKRKYLKHLTKNQRNLYLQEFYE